MRTIVALGLILTVAFSVKSQTTWKMVSSGTEYGFALRSDSTLWCWGFNGNGQLGTGNPGTDTPVQLGTEHNWIKVACGAFHTLAIKSDGTLDKSQTIKSIKSIPLFKLEQIKIGFPLMLDSHTVQPSKAMEHFGCGVTMPTVNWAMGLLQTQMSQRKWERTSIGSVRH
jgi:hypothetical protein